MRFTKMHGCGNDYVYVDAWDEALPDDLPALARAVSDRHRGIGADGLIVVGPGRDGADASMLMWNADGSESEMCGNGIRCAAKLAWDRDHLDGNRRPRIATGAGVLAVDLRFTGSTCTGASVDMGRPRLTAAEVPVNLPGHDLTLMRQGLRLRAVGMGNPHAVAVVVDPDAFAVAEIGPRIETDPVFPRRTNVEFTALAGVEHGLPVIRQRTWERGSGITLACGTGACAVLVAWILDRLIPTREAIIRLDGGDLRVAWPRDDASVRMEGEAVTVFEGAW